MKRRHLAACLIWVMTAATFAAASSCSHDSFLVVTLKSKDNTGFTDINLVRVYVKSDTPGVAPVILEYNSPAQPIAFDKDNGKTLSIQFTPSRSGTVTLKVTVHKEVTATNRFGLCVGEGTVDRQMIDKGRVAKVTVELTHTTACTSFDTDPDGGVDGGTGTDASTDGPVTFPGCDPVNPSCPMTGQTCYVNCESRAGLCVAGGTKGPGENCTGNNDCMPGTQCFDYTGIPGCAAATRVCLKFCNSDAQCSAATDGGMVGPVGSACVNPVICPAISAGQMPIKTSYSTCSFSCDPRGDAMRGCPQGLRCFLYTSAAGSQQVPDCGCSNRGIKAENMACTASTECQVGLVCDTTGMTCRRLCRMDTPTDCTSPQACVALTNSKDFGVCR